MGVCRRRCYPMAITGMSCIRVMQNGRAVCPNACCVQCVVHLWQRAVTLFGAGRLLFRAALGMLCRFARWWYRSSSWAQAFVPLGPGRASMGPAFGQLRSFSTLPHRVRLWAVGSLSILPHCSGQWAAGRGGPAELRDSYGQWGSFCPMPHCLGAVGSRTSRTSVAPCRTNWGQWAV